MERQPIKTIPIHEHLRPRLCDTYENDSIFDKFEVVFSGDAKNVMTGSYNNNFMIYPSDPEKETEVVLQADKSAFKAKKVGVATPINSATSPTANGGKKGGSRAGSPAGTGQGQRMRKETDADQIDFNKKILHMSWHPFEDSIAIAATNNVSHLIFQLFCLGGHPTLTGRSCLCSRHCKPWHEKPLPPTPLAPSGRRRTSSSGQSYARGFARFLLDGLTIGSWLSGFPALYLAVVSHPAISGTLSPSLSFSLARLAALPAMIAFGQRCVSEPG